MRELILIFFFFLLLFCHQLFLYVQEMPCLEFWGVLRRQFRFPHMMFVSDFNFMELFDNFDGEITIAIVLCHRSLQTLLNFGMIYSSAAPYGRFCTFGKQTFDSMYQFEMCDTRSYDDFQR